LEEDDYQKRMVKLKRGQKNSYDRRHGRTGDLADDQALHGEEVVSDQSSGPVPCQVFMNVTQKPYQVVSSHSVPSLMSLDFTEPPRDPYPGRYRPRVSGAPATISRPPAEPETRESVEMYRVPGIPSLRVTVEPDDFDAPVDDLTNDPEIEIHLASDNCVPEEDLVFLRASDKKARETIQSGAIRSVSAEELNERLGTRGSIQGGSVQSVQAVQEEGICIAVTHLSHIRHTASRGSGAS